MQNEKTLFGKLNLVVNSSESFGLHKHYHDYFITQCQVCYSLSPFDLNEIHIAKTPCSLLGIYTTLHVYLMLLASRPLRMRRKKEGLVPACAKVKADTSCVRKLGAHLELISFCIALRILYAGFEECCWCHLPWKHSWRAVWRQKIPETKSHSWYFSHSHVQLSGNWHCLTD